MEIFLRQLGSPVLPSDRNTEDRFLLQTELPLVTRTSIDGLKAPVIAKPALHLILTTLQCTPIRLPKACTKLPEITKDLRRTSFMRRISVGLNLAATITLCLVLLFGFAQIGLAQTPTPLALNNNYMVTGDYVVGGWTKTGSTTINGTLMSSGTISIPDPQAYALNVPLQQVPAGADIVAAYLYWETVENSGVHSGQNGLFQGYPISGALLGNPNAPVSWSSGGCAGAANGSKTIVAYRAEVSSLLPVDANGNIQPNTTYQLSLPDSGKVSQPPFASGATLLIVYRLLAPSVPLNAVLIYDGAFAPSNTSTTMTQPIQGFFQAGNDQPGGLVVSKITHIVANGQSNKIENVTLNGVPLPSIYPNFPPFKGNYNGTWDNPTWFPNTLGNVVKANDASASTSVVPDSSNKGCVTWGAIIMSTTVQDSDLDGLPDVAKINQGYCDAGANRGMSNQGSCLPLGVNDPSWVALPGATHGSKDIFVQLDYMCLANPDGTTNCDPANGGISYGPDPQALANLTTAFSANGHGINVHIDPNHHIIPAFTCVDSVDAHGNPLYCPNPGQAGAVGWKSGYSFLKTQPLNYPDETSCEAAGALCQRRFQPGRNNSYHEVIFAVASAVPNWSLQEGSISIAASGGNTLTLTTATPHGLTVNAMTPNGRITIAGAISNPSLNGTYLVQSVPTTTSFTIQTAAATIAPTKATDPTLSVSSGVVTTGSGVSDIGGADSLVSLGLWGADGRTVPVQSGTLMHELGHSLSLTHGGLYRTLVAGGYSFSVEPNCKSNFQSVMNYLFQVDLLDGALDYSNQDLTTINEGAASTLIPSALANAIHPTTDWYAPNQPIGSAATSHCDGTPLLPADPPSFRLQRPASSMTWSANQDLNFDGEIEASLQGYNDWANVDLRQIGASGNDFWVAGGVPLRQLGGGVPLRQLGGGIPLRQLGGGVPLRQLGGGVVDFTVKAANSIVRTATNVSATLTPANTVQLGFTPPSFGQSQIAAFNVYRSVNGGPFSKPPYATLPVTGTPLPLPNSFTFTDTHVSCATYSYFVTTVLSDTRESLPSTTAGPITVPCTFVGFLSPLGSAGTISAPSFSGTANQGSAIPVKYEILDANGNPIGDLSTLKLMQACPTTGKTVPPATSTVPPCVLLYSPTIGAKGNSTFRFSSPQFIFNWDTASTIGSVTGFFTLEVTLSDGSAVKATTIQFK
jgi:hypothetical protein